jgi:hypothetical protein
MRAAFGAFDRADDRERCSVCSRPSSAAGELRRVPFFGQRAPWRRSELVGLTLCAGCYARPRWWRLTGRAPEGKAVSP